MDLVDVQIDGLADAVEIGRGGFGAVYKAMETDLGREVAVKILHGPIDDKGRLRFDRERRAMGSLSGHPNIVTVFRTGFNGEGAPYIVMEYLSGGSLADLLAKRGRLPWEEVVRYGIDVAEAMASAHASGVLHRDIKPGNILLSANGTAKLGDFGIARLQGAPETKSAMITASLAHAPPEVLSGARPDELADLYSLASTLFELSWGVPAFINDTDESLAPLLARITSQQPPSLTHTGMPKPVAEVIERGLAKSPTARYRSVSEFSQALSAAAEQAKRQPGIPTATQAKNPTPGRTTPPLPPPAQGSPRRPTTGPMPLGPGQTGPNAARPSNGPPSIMSLHSGANPRGAQTDSSPPNPHVSGPQPRITGPQPHISGPLPHISGPQPHISGPLPHVSGPQPVSTPPKSNQGAPPGRPPWIPILIGVLIGLIGLGIVYALSSRGGNAETTTAPPSTTISSGLPTIEISTNNRAIRVLVPPSWSDTVSGTKSLIASANIDLALDNAWVSGLSIFVEPINDPDNFSVDTRVQSFILSSDCTRTGESDWEQNGFNGRRVDLDQCGDENMRTMFFFGALPERDTSLFVLLTYSEAETDYIPILLNSLRIEASRFDS